MGLKREELIGGWRKLRREELPELHFLPSIRMIKSGGYDGETRRKRQRERTRRVDEDNIKTDLKGISW